MFGDGIMREHFLNANLNYINSKLTFDERKQKIIRYGLECIYTMITKSTVVILLSILLGTFNETLLLIIFYTFVRMFGFGIHATSNIRCWIVSLSSYSILPLIIKYADINQIVVISCELIAFVCLLLWAPADTKKRPLIHKDKRIKDKVIVLSISFVYIIYSISFINIISKTMMFGLVIEAVCTCPLTYIIFKQPFNNYKSMV
jgi:accessory gene regulator B